jgi:hypothetical protein
LFQISRIFIEGQDFKHTSDYSKIRSFSANHFDITVTSYLFYILNYPQFLDPFGSNCLFKQKQPYKTSQPRGVWWNRLCFHLQVKYYLHNSILVALNRIAEAENHFSPEECGGIDYASIYRLSITYKAPPFLLPSIGLLRRRIILARSSVAKSTMLPSRGKVLPIPVQLLHSCCPQLDC